MARIEPCAVAVIHGSFEVRPSAPCHPRSRFPSFRQVIRHAFRHPADTFAFKNDTLWSYSRDPRTGHQVHLRRDPPPEYHLRCFVMARSAKQFFAHARFDPASPPLAPEDYARRLRQVVRRNPRLQSGEADRVRFPGFADLRSFSAAFPDLCRAGLGGAWQSYVQRGHWRMILPYTRRGQLREAGRLRLSVESGRAPVVHLFRFPALTINHAVVAFAVQEIETGWQFLTYDPNLPDDVLPMVFNRQQRQFSLPPNLYFIGGRVEAYEVYCGLFR